MLEILGKKFNRLLVLSKLGLYCKVLCDCGTVKMVRTDKLTSGSTKSCGCYMADFNAAQKLALSKPKPAKPVKEPRSRDEVRLCAIYTALRSRCYNPNNKDYSRYGGRGIAISPEWQDVKIFLADMLPLYRPGAWLERIDNDGPYSKENCVFATPLKQARNRRNNVPVRIKSGQVVPLAAAAARAQLPYNIAYNYYHKLLRANPDTLPTYSELHQESVRRGFARP